MNSIRKNENVFFARGIPVVAFVAALVLAGCPVDSVPDPGTSAPESRSPMGPVMNLTGQVYIWVSDEEEYRVFEGDRRIVAAWYMWRNLGGEGAINGGQLSFNIGTPGFLTNIGSLFESYDDQYDNFTIRPMDARAVLFYAMVTEGDGRGGRLQRLRSETRETEAGIVSTLDEVYYIYVDRDVTIIGRGRYDSGAGFAEGRPYSFEWRFEDLNMFLEAGWNVIHIRSQTAIEDGHFSTITSKAAHDPGTVSWDLWETENGDVVDLPSPRWRGVNR